MTRVSHVDDQSVDDELLQHFFRGCAALNGRVANSMRVYAHVPMSAVTMLPFLVSLQREGAGGRLDAQTKELVVLATSFTNACKYCVTHNTSLGIATGLSMEQIEAVRDDDPADDVLGARDRAVVRWAKAVTLNEAARDKAAYEALAEYFDESEIVEITWLSAMFNMLNRVHDSLQIDLEVEEQVQRIGRSVRVEQEAVVDWMAETVRLLQRRLERAAADGHTPA